jgi:hypothetical protein
VGTGGGRPAKSLGQSARFYVGLARGFVDVEVRMQLCKRTELSM